MCMACAVKLKTLMHALGFSHTSAHSEASLVLPLSLFILSYLIDSSLMWLFCYAPSDDISVNMHYLLSCVLVYTHLAYGSVASYFDFSV